MVLSSLMVWVVVLVFLGLSPNPGVGIDTGNVQLWHMACLPRGVTSNQSQYIPKQQSSVHTKAIPFPHVSPRAHPKV